VTAVTNRGFITRWDKLNTSKVLQVFGRLYTDLFNVQLVLMPDVSLQIRWTKALPSFYMMGKETNSKTTLKFLEAQLLKRVKPEPVTLLAHTATMNPGAPTRYYMPRI